MSIIKNTMLLATSVCIVISLTSVASQAFQADNEDYTRATKCVANYVSHSIERKHITIQGDTCVIIKK